MLPGDPVPLFNEATHLFCDFNKLKPDESRVFIEEAAAQNMACLKTEYIADYLMLVCLILFSLPFLTIIVIIICVGGWHMCASMRILCRNCSSPTMWVQRIKLRSSGWWQVPVLAKSFC